MSQDAEFKWVDGNLKGDLGSSNFNIKGRADGNHSAFVGHKAGISGDIGILKVEKQLSQDVKVGASGPSAGASLGLKMGTETELAAIVEPSLVKAEGQVAVTDNASLCGSVGLNATTGVKVNEEGFKAGFLGFGLTMGLGGKYTFDTPFGSVGACATQTNANTNRSSSTRRNGNEERNMTTN